MILSERYRDFTMLETPVPFNILMEGRNISIVQVHDATPVGNNDIVGFAGVFCWKDGQAVPLDGDIYNKSMTVRELPGYKYPGFKGKKPSHFSHLTG